MKIKLDDNLNFKFVALGVAVILWASILGRKDSTMTRTFELQVLLAPNLEMTEKILTSVKIEVAGPRVALKKINQTNPVYTVDLSSARPGRQVVRLNGDGLSLPIGSRILNIEPSEFTVRLRQGQPQEIH